jgi:hypothetical protein
MSCPHGVWHAEDCDDCKKDDELADCKSSYASLFKANSELRAENARLLACLSSLYHSIQDVLPGTRDDWRKAKESDSYALRGHTGTVKYRADDMHLVYVQMEDVRLLLEAQP